MGRSKVAFSVIAFCLLALIAMLVQIDGMSAQPQPPDGGGDPPFAQPPVVDPIEPPTGAEGEATIAPSPTPPPDPNMVMAREVRSDLERLADQTMNFTRPPGWIGTDSINNPNLIIDTRLDLEILAGTLLGSNTRPDGWFGTIPSTTTALVRDLRHDVELLADSTVSGRPDGWTSIDPLMRCGRLTQAVVQFLQLNGVFSLSADPFSPDFCEQAEIQASTFIEINILANPQAGQSLVVQGLAITGSNATVNSNFAAAFLDRFASQRVGVVPNGTSIRVIGRSGTEFSNMMLIEGNDFQVFVDYQFTSITSPEFDNLSPIDETSITPFCNASWCD